MRMIVELEKKAGEWSARCKAPDGVLMLESFGMEREETVTAAKSFLDVCAQIIGS